MGSIINRGTKAEPKWVREVQGRGRSPEDGEDLGDLEGEGAPVLAPG